MNRSLFTILTLTLLAIGSCDTPNNVAPRNLDFFIKMFEGVRPDDQYSNQYGVDIIETSDGGLLIAGTSENSNDSTEILVIKTDNRGNREWDFGGSAVLGTIQSKANSIIELESGGYLVGGTTLEAKDRPVLIKLDANGNPDNPIFIDNVDDNGVTWESSLSKITEGESGILVCGNTLRPRNSQDNSGSNFFFCLYDKTSLQPVIVVDDHVVIGGRNDKAEFAIGAYEVDSVADNNIHFLIFTTYEEDTGNKSFSFFGFSDQFTAATDNFILDPARNQNCYGVYEKDNRYWMVGDSEGSQLYLLGWEWKPSEAIDWGEIRGTGDVNSTTPSIGKGVAVQNGNNLVVAGNSIFPDDHTEIFLSGLNLNRVKAGWPQYFGTNTSSYTASNVIVLQDGSIVTLGTADLEPIKKIVVIKTGPNGEMSFE